MVISAKGEIIPLPFSYKLRVFKKIDNRPQKDDFLW